VCVWLVQDNVGSATFNERAMKRWGRFVPALSVGFLLPDWSENSNGILPVPGAVVYASNVADFYGASGSGAWRVHLLSRHGGVLPCSQDFSCTQLCIHVCMQVASDCKAGHAIPVPRAV
jgi:hypothetical protein